MEEVVHQLQWKKSEEGVVDQLRKTLCPYEMDEVVDQLQCKK